MKTLSILIVNYNTAPLVRDVVRSLLSPESPHLDLEVVVADNGSAPEDQALLRRIEGIRLVALNENLGFAKANNTALSESRGDYILFLNPDTHVFPGALDSLVRFLGEHPDTGAVGPRLWWDTKRTFLLPPPYLPTPRLILAWTAAKRIPWMGRKFRGWWIRESRAYWSSQSPLEMRALSGAAICTTRQVLDRVGPFDDGRFFMYFEDVDWCVRVRKAGMKVMYLPEAHVAHFYNQSGKGNQEAVGRFMDASRRNFFSKHYGPYALRWEKRVDRCLSGMGRWMAPIPYEPVRDVSRDTVFHAEEDREAGPYLFLVGVNPLLFPCGGVYSKSGVFRIPDEMLGRLGPGAYYCALVRAYEGTVLRSWTWCKP